MDYYAEYFYFISDNSKKCTNLHSDDNIIVHDNIFMLRYCFALDILCF